MNKVAKRLLVAALIAAISAGAFLIYWLANPPYEDDGIAILTTRRTTSNDGKRANITAYYQNRSGTEAAPLIVFALFDEQGEVIGFAEGQKQGVTKTPNGWFGHVDCQMVKFEYMTINIEDLSVEEQTEGVAGWELACIY